MRHFWALLASALAITGCVPTFEGIFESARVSGDVLAIVEITKWKGGARSAYTPTYDHPELNGPEVEWLIAQGLAIDFEVVTDSYDQQPHKYIQLLSLAERGFGYFGHGHRHVNHDALTYEQALESFRTNFEHMSQAGLRPVAYAYPGGYGFQESTRRALKDAGFLSGRLGWTWTSRHPYIMPGYDTVPQDWYRLPALYMQDYNFDGCAPCINNPLEFTRQLDSSIQKGAWLISVYHAIGMDGKNGQGLGWGYYDRNNFYREMARVKTLRDERRLWVAGLNAVTLYVLERNATTWSTTLVSPATYEIRLTNSLDKSRFTHPLTLRLQIPQNNIGQRLRVWYPGNPLPLADQIASSHELLLDLVPADRPYTVTFD